MASLINVELCTGLFKDDERNKEARLRSVTGEDEAALLDASPDLLPAEITTLLLTRLVDSIGSISAIREDEIRLLTTGDRERLLFALSSTTFSEEVDLVSRCPFEECGALSEFALPLKDLIQTKQTGGQDDSFEIKVSIQGDPVTVRFRMPTGHDQEKAGRLLLETPVANVELELVEACIAEITGHKGNIPPDPSLLGELKPLLENAWSDLDPASDPFAKFNCPECDREYTALLDALSIFKNGLHNRGDLFDQVHRLAKVYHWSERDVLGLTFDRRQRYLQLVDSQARSL